MKSVKSVLAGASIALLMTGLTVSPARANDLAAYTTVFNTDVRTFGLGGMRALGTGSITVAGVTGTVTRALLYWHGPTRSTVTTVNAAVNFAGTPVTGTNIGMSSDNCWGFTNSQAYRADVTSLVTGNGSFALAGFTKTDAEVNGASLVVFFDDGNPANNRDFVMFDGNDSNTTNTFDAPGWNVSLTGVNYVSGAVSMDLIVSDGQTFSDADLRVNATTIAATPNVFQGDSVPTAGSNNNGFLWDVKSYAVTTLLTPGPNTLNLTTTYLNDCLSLIVAAVNLPAGAAPNQPPTTTTTAPTTTTPTTATTIAPTTATTAPVAVVVQPRFTG